MKKIKLAIVEFFTPVPEIKNDYVEKVVHLLRRDFTTAEQNDIILSITKKLGELREKDMVKMEENYRVLQNDHVMLKQHLLC